MRITTAAVLAALTAAAAPAPSADAVGFDPPVTVREFSRRPAATPVPAVNDAGRTGLAYVETRGRNAAVVVARGTLRKPRASRDVVASNGAAPQIAITPSGRTVVAWSRVDRDGRTSLHLRTARDGERFHPTQRLPAHTTRGRLFSHQIVPFAADRFLVFWSEPGQGTSDARLRYVVSTPSGRLGPARGLGRGSVAAAPLSDGSVLVAMVTDQGRRLVRRVLHPQKKHLASAGPDTRPVSEGARMRAVTMTRGFSTVLAWAEFGASSLRLRMLLGPPHDVVTLDSPDLERRFAEGPAIGMPAGGPVAAWSVVDRAPGEGERTTSGTVFASSYVQDQGFSEPIQLSAPDEIATAPSLAPTRGLGVIVWRTGRFPRYGVQYATRDVPGTFRRGRALSNASMHGATIASSQSGVLAAWIERRDGPRQAVKVAVLRDGWELGT